MSELESLEWKNQGSGEMLGFIAPPFFLILSEWGLKESVAVTAILSFIIIILVRTLKYILCIIPAGANSSQWSSGAGWIFVNQ